MRTILRIFIWLLVVFATLTVGLYTYLRNADLSVYENQIEGFLSNVIGHKIDFDGLFELHFGNHTELTAEQIRLTNPDWPSGSEIASVGHLSVTVDLWSLISGPIVIEDLDVNEVRIHLERNAEGQANWDSGKVREESKENGGIDADLIAFREVEIQDVQLVLVDPARRRPLNVAIESWTVNPDQNRILDLDLNGQVNELAIWADGKLGPWDNLIERKSVTADLDLRLGQVRLSINGSAEDLSNLTGVEISLELGGPHIDSVIAALGLPPFAEGEFRVEGRTSKQLEGNQFRLEGNLGAIYLLAAGTADKLINTAHAKLDFSVTGPNTKHIAEVFGVKGAPDDAFHMSGDLTMDGKRFEFSDTRAQIGDNNLGADGWVDLGGPIPIGDITVKASGADFSIVGPFANLPGMPSEEFEVHGHIKTTGKSWRFDNVEAIVGENRLAADGAIGEKGSPDTEIRFSATGPDISILGPITGLDGIQPRAFDISAVAKPDPAGIRIENAKGDFGEIQLGVDGVLSTKKGFRGTDLLLSAKASDLRYVALLAGVPYLPDGPFTAGVRARIDRRGLRLSDGTADVGGMSGTVSGTIALGTDAGAFDLDLSVSGPDLADALKFEWLDRLSGEEFVLQGQLEHRDGEFELNSVSAHISDFEINADGDFVIADLTGDVTVRASAPDGEELRKLIGLPYLPNGAVSVSGRIEKLESELEFSDVSANIGEYSIEADGTLSNAPMSNRSDLRFSASGPELREIGESLGVDDLPMKPYSLSFEVNGIPTGFAIEKFIAKVGENDIDGKLTADLRGKPEATGYLSSSYLDLRTRWQSAETEVESDVEEASEFLFSDEPLNLDWLQAANIDVSIKTDRLMLPYGDVHDFRIDLNLWDGVFRIDPILFRESDGSVSGSIVLGPSEDSYGLDVVVSAEDMNLGLLATEDQDRSTVPPVHGHIDVSGKGSSLHDLMASLNGEMKLRQETGRIRDFAGSRLFGDLFLQVLRTLNPMRTRDQYRTLECGIYDFEFTDGVATIESLAIQTDKMTYVVMGNLNFENERLRLSFKATPREGIGVSIGGVANSFVRLGGTLREPQLKIDTASSMTTTGAAVATGGLSLVAKGLWDRVKAEADICKDPEQ